MSEAKEPHADAESWSHVVRFGEMYAPIFWYRRIRNVDLRGWNFGPFRFIFGASLFWNRGIGSYSTSLHRWPLVRRQNSSLTLGSRCASSDSSSLTLTSAFAAVRADYPNFPSAQRVCSACGLLPFSGRRVRFSI